jgi:hypothetical protein
VRIAVFHGRKYYLRNVATALEALDDRGHELVLALSEKKAKYVDAQTAVRPSPGISTVLYPHRRDDGLDTAQRLVRAVRDAARYEAPPLADAHANRKRAYRKLAHAFAPDRPAGGAAEPPSLGVTASDLAALTAVCDAVELLIPPSEPLVGFIRGLELDAAVVISRVNFGGNDAGVVDAARAAGVPVGVVVYSWDNLSSKALLHERPDRLFVWNDVMAQEAVELHGLDPASVVATGAPRFDEFFALSPSTGRDELRSSFGLDPSRPTVLYLGSSGYVSKREPEFLDRWLAALPADVQVIVRPHPGAADEPAWAAWQPSREGVAVPPLHRRPQELFDQLTAADAVVALNTSAELEAAIADRPVLTVGVGDLAPGQEGSSHFRYLLENEGGFVEETSSLEEHLEQLALALTDDPHAAARRAFLERFVRPRGLDRPAGPELADEIEKLAG